jgi:hypothetical protein
MKKMEGNKPMLKAEILLTGKQKYENGQIII